MADIKAIDKSTVHRICSGQVVLNLATAVKELVENSIDAGATVVDVRLKEFGSELVEVSDNGCGVHPSNFEGLTLKHHTSKLRDFSDLISVETFGFRGEALSSLCALSELSVLTRHESEPCGTALVFDRNGHIIDKKQQSRQVGTTVSLVNLFSSLPVRQKEFHKNLKREFNKMIQLLYAYCLVSTGVRITCINQTKKGSRTTYMATQGCKSVKENISCIFGAKQLNSLLEIKQRNPGTEVLDELKLTLDDCSTFQLEGYISSCAHGVGRGTNDRQFYYINSRPCEPSKIVKQVNEVYHQFNGNQYPFVYLNITVNKGEVDVNVTPDKRQIFLTHEKLILAIIKASLLDLFEKIPSTYSTNVLSSKSISNCRDTETIKSNGLSKFDLWRHKSDKNDNKRRLDVLTANNASPKKQMKMESSIHSQRTMESFSYRINGKKEQSTMDNDRVTSIKPVNGLSVHCEENISKNALISNSEPDMSSNVTLESQTSSLIENQNKGPNLDKPSTKCSSSPERSSYCVESQKAPEDNDINMVPQSVSVETKSSDPLESSTLNVTQNLEASFNNTNDSLGNINISMSCTVDDHTDNSLVNNERDELDSKPIVYDEFEERGMKCVSFPVGLEHVKEAMKKRNSTGEEGNMTSVRFRATIEPSKNDQAEQELNKEISKDKFEKMEIIGQFNLGFIITKLGSDLFIIDQHATDEKYNFEMLQKTTVISNQKLVNPQILELTAANECVLMENIEVFRKNGFEFDIDEEAPPTQRVKLTAIPMSKNWVFGKDDIDELIFMLEDSPGTDCRPSRVRAMFASRACRKSVMIGTALSHKEMRRLVDNMGTIEQPWNCPHGRPTMRHLVNLELINTKT